MHNDRVNRRPVACAAILAAATLALAGCGGDSSSTPVAGSSGSSGTSATSETTKPAAGSSSADPAVTVQGVTLTDQGTKLKVGQAAKVSWHPNQKTTGVMKVSVTKLQKVPISAFSDWRLDPATQRSTPFFVHATVHNLGRTPLSGVPVPLYLLDGRNTLLQASTFRAQFPACPSTPLPAKFTRGKKASVCLVYFAPDHGKLVAVSFRPSQDFNAITWSGPLAKPKPPTS
jgi:hypothetical protein